MFKRITNWHLSILVVVVSVLSTLLVQQYVFAQWQDPTTEPGQSGSTNLVVTPMVTNLDLNGKTIVDTDFSLDPGGTIGLEISGNTWAGYFTGDVKVTGDLDVASINGATPGSIWTENGTSIYYSSGNVGIGTNNPSSLLHLATKSGSLELSATGLSETMETPLNISSVNDIVLQPNAATAMTLKESGYVGLGTTSPNKRLHVYEAVGNAEIDIQSGSKVAGYWGIYQDATTSDLRFWSSDNKVTFTDEGYVGIGKISPTRMLDVEGDGVTAVHGEVNASGIYGVHGENNADAGVLGEGLYGVRGEAAVANGVGIYGVQGSGAYAGYFAGTLRIVDSASDTGYLHLNSYDGTPPATDCDSNDERGRMIWNYTDDELFICDYYDSGGGGGGGGWKYEVMQIVEP
jgi:hypothetical protein